MTDIKFVGDYTGFLFMVDTVLQEVSMNAAGFIVMMEPDVTVGRYDTWEAFQAAHPEFAAIMVQVIQRKMNETIHMINELRFAQELPDVPSELRGEQPVDMMFHRAYQ